MGALMSGEISSAQSKLKVAGATKKQAEIQYSLELIAVNKRFKRQTLRAGYTTLKSAMLRMFSRKAGNSAAEVTQAISDLTIRIPSGASVGIIGRNGSGKSTLLKLISGIYKPDSGQILVHGRVAALIELGAGFHPDFSGRENLMLGGVIHGLTKTQIEAQLDNIIKFSIKT